MCPVPGGVAIQWKCFVLKCSVFDILVRSKAENHGSLEVNRCPSFGTNEQKLIFDIKNEVVTRYVRNYFAFERRIERRVLAIEKGRDAQRRLYTNLSKTKSIVGWFIADAFQRQLSRLSNTTEEKFSIWFRTFTSIHPFSLVSHLERTDCICCSVKPPVKHSKTDILGGFIRLFSRRR